ncbi:MAG: hypothetical protein KGZ65_03810 [Sphingomonadales bacterium]|nr:hypothetical protein [Sphingomonadaceae bacterium]MBS3930337.1 hypothetical protein [Sphingomonadales bacterium]
MTAGDIPSIVAAAEPLDVPASEDSGGGGGALPPDAPPDDIDWDLLRRCAAEDANDVGNGRRLRHRFGHELIHVQAIEFYAWDLRRWQEDADGKVSRPLCHKVADLLHFEPLVLESTAAEAEAMAEAEMALSLLKAAEAALSTADDEAKGPLKMEIENFRAAIAEGRKAKAALARRRKARRGFAISTGNSGKIAGMLSEAVPYLSRKVDDLDRDPYALNLMNGTLRFVGEDIPNPLYADADVSAADVPPMITRWSARLDSHNRLDMITKLCDAEWRPSAPRPTFDRFIARILPSLPVRAFVQRFLGYGLTALTREQVFCLFHGEGRNGKSTLIDVVAKILSDYSTSLPVSTLVNDNRSGKGSEATPDLARLPGARLVRAAEPREGLSFDESLIKGLTSGEPIPVRRLNREFLDIYPTFKLVISANRKPTIKGNDDGIWRRVLLVPFDVQIPEEEMDRELPAKLWAERDGILAWLVEGCLAYLDGGLKPPEEVSGATREYREESDVVGAFVRGAIVVTGASYDTVEAGELYHAYEVWCRRNGQTPVMSSTFNRRMPKAAAQFGFTKGKASVSRYHGIQILPEFKPRQGALKEGE